MAIKTSNLKKGDILYSVQRVREGNTTRKVQRVWRCVVTEVADDGSWARISFNGNPARKIFRSTTYRRSPPEWIKDTAWEVSRRCYFCRNAEEEGHKDGCQHPKAKKS